MGDEIEIAHHHLDNLTFGVYGAEEIKDISVKEVTNSQIFDSLMHASYGGLYDPALGPQENFDVCTSCGLGTNHCPGHMGHISLPLPVYNPLLFSTLFQLLRGICFSCHKVLMKKCQSVLIQCQMRLLDHGLVTSAEQLSDVYNAHMRETGPGMQEEIVIQLMAYTENALKEIDDLEEARNRSKVKHVTESRQNIIKKFMRGNFFSKSSCIHCGTKIRTLRKEHNTKIFFAAKVEKRATSAAIKLVEAKMKRNQQFEQDLESPDNIVGKVKEVFSSKYLTPVYIQKHIKQAWELEKKLLSSVIGAFNPKGEEDASGIDIFFLDVVSVPPSRFRPMAKMRDSVFENPQTSNLNNILKGSWAIKDILHDMHTEKNTPKDTDKSEESKDEKEGMTTKQKLQDAWLQLQLAVNSFYNSDLNKLSIDKQPGIKQLLEKKQGLFRKHMMGKRVNFAARSVISPDPYICTNEIGIPLVFAKHLTYPQPVTPWNMHELKQAVMNGPDVHPGAIKVQNEDGSTVLLQGRNKTQREAIAKQLLTPAPGNKNPGASKTVHRHLKNGDVLLLNRQPTLHRPSIQAHKARVLPGQKTLRLHYANCKAYNADFDGDEMNAHFPQNEICRAEAYNLVSTDYNYLVPKDGTPLAGLIQDHMISGVKLTMRGRYFTRIDYHQLVFGALSGRQTRISLLPPTILKPEVLWSGKQVLSTVLLNIFPKDKSPLNLNGTAKVVSKNWINGKPRPWKAGGTPMEGNEMSESEVVIRQGELLVGILDKAHYGSTPYGLVHSCYELYGGPVAGQVLTALARLFTSFLQWHGFTLGVADILVTGKADRRRRKVMKQGHSSGCEAVAKALGVEDSSNINKLKQRIGEAQFSKEDGEMKDLDLQMKSETDEIQNKIVGVVMPIGLQTIFPENNLQLMVQAGAKGSSVNCMQISCLLGQIELEGRRPPLMLSGQSLPSFLPYDTRPRAGGFVDGRFLTGIRPQEYYFHCMAGREGLIDTAVKTSRSGYLQRCIIKHLEGLVVNYDLTVRDGDGSIVQFQYGEDGLDIMKTQYLDSKQFHFLISNQKALKTEKEMEELQQKLGQNYGNSDQVPDRYNCSSESLPKIVKFFRKQFKKWKELQSPDGSAARVSPFLKWCGGRFDDLRQEGNGTSDGSGSTRSAASKKACEVWAQLDGGKERVKMEKKYDFLRHEPDPFHCVLRQDRHFGITTEKFEDTVEKYINEDKDKLVVSEEDDSKDGKIAAQDLKDLLYLKHLQSLVQPGEAVGLIAAQSIGEPSTQMTLNTFHFAGRGEMNVTLGIPRLREILMVATANLKTPSMDVPLLDTPYARKKAKLLQQKFTRVFLSQVLEDVEITECLTIKALGKKDRKYRIRLSFLPHAVYKDEYYVTPARVLAYVEKHYFLKLVEAIKKKRAETSSLLHNATVKRQKTAPVDKDDDDADDIVDDDLHDNDAAAAKVRQRQDEELEYEGEEEEMEEVMEEAVEEDNGSDDQMDTSSSDGEDQEEDDEDQVEKLKKQKAKKRKKQMEAMNPKRIAAVLNRQAEVSDYKYDADEELWCEITLQFPLSKSHIDMGSLVTAVAKASLVAHTRGIRRCFMVQSKKPGEEGTHLKTEGVNILELYNHQDILDINKLYCNDIHAVARMYGIEAACRAIIKEIRDVFAAYGINVDYRHLSLIADYMTFEGTYKSFSRGGIESNPSPLQKITFETSLAFLKSATLQGATDTLSSPSSQLVVGRLTKGGTGAFDLIQPL